jgi:PAS domain S-box-containing protein
MSISSIYATVFKNSPIGCYLLSTTPEVTVLDVSDAFLEDVSLTREELVGRPLFEVFTRDPDDSGDSGTEALRTSIAEAVATGRPQTLRAQRFPIARKLENGETRYEERFWDASNTPIFDESGQMVCIYHATIDVTQQVRTQRAMKCSERQAVEAARRAEAERYRLDAVLEAAPVGIGVADADGRLLLVNQECRRIWGHGLRLSENVDEYGDWKGWWADGSPQHGQRIQAHEWPLARALEEKRDVSTVVEIESFDSPGVRRTAFISSAPIRRQGEDPDGAVVVVMDITDRVRAEKTLKEADRRKDEFLAMLAHELRNPLAPISAAADLLRIGQPDGVRIQKASTIISRQVAHMAGLINDLLDASRVTRGLVVLDKERLDLKQIVADAVEQVRPLLEAHEHRLALHIPPEPALVLGDQKRMVQVLSNILVNAAKFTPTGGDITLAISVDSGQVQVVVTDNGVGMDAALLGRAFELFSQAERTSDRSQGGLGIGLALVKSLVELHGGQVAAYSEGAGRGSRVAVRLPHITGQNDRGDIPHRQNEAGRRASTQLKVMVVDDNADAAYMLASVVEALGHEVIVEIDPIHVIPRARVERPQVFLLDIGLPGIDGNELARRLRAAPETAKALLVAVTGYGRDQDREASMRSGFDHHFVKPVDTTAIADLLRTAEVRRGGAASVETIDASMLGKTGLFR